MKSICKYILTLIMVLSFIVPCAFSAFAEGEAIITVGTVTGKPGQTVTVPISVSNNPGFSAFAFGFEYDQSVLTVVSADPSESIGGQSSFKTKLVWFNSGNYTDDGEIAALTVSISEDAKEGNYQIRITCEPGDFSDYDEKDVPFIAFSGSVNVKKESLSDASDIFEDVNKDDWFTPYVTYAYNNGLMKGTSSNRFSPNDPMNRAMLVTVLWRVENSPAADPSPFTDLYEDWYSEAVAWAYKYEIVKGTSSTTFSPNDPLTRSPL